MISGWHDADAQRISTPLGLRAYTSRLVGSDRSLVLYGGGNTSLKQDGVLYVKSSGSDLATATGADFSELDLDALHALLQDNQLDDDACMRGVNACKRDPLAARPSIETLLHAALPHTYIEHAHADAVLAVANVVGSEKKCTTVFGTLAPWVPYRHSGVALARAALAAFNAHGTDETIGLILAFHGVVAFGQSARASYDNLLRLTALAEDFLQRHGAQAVSTNFGARTATVPAPVDLQQTVSAAAGFPLAMKVIYTPATRAFAARPDLDQLSQQGPPTPQHAIYTKRVPLIDGDVAAYGRRYRAYLQGALGDAGLRIDMAPRIALSPAFGLCAFGINEHYAAVAAEIYLHDIVIMTRAAAHGTYRSANDEDIARAELDYGGFEQRVRASMQSALPSES